MANADSQKPSCPVCKQADQVKTMKNASNSGILHCAPPDMPIRVVNMSRTILFCTVLVGVCVFSILVLIGSEADLGLPIQGTLVSITLISIITALVLSYKAFNRVVKGDNEATERFPDWDRAVAIWRSLYYCARDKVVFDPNTNRVLSEEELDSLRNLDNKLPEIAAASLAH